MTETPARASAVIIGAGIVGNSLVHHLALLGWRDLVLVDKGPMPNPGGSTGHASNFIFPIEYSKMMFELTEDSTAQYKQLGVFTQSGGIEVARTPERMIELRRRCSQAKAWGIPAELVTPGEVNKLVPYLDESVILGGAHFPTVGVVDSLRAGTLMRESAQKAGALTVLAGTEVHGISVEGGRVRSVTTSAGEIETDNVVICCGVWSPRIARMAGARLALTPTVHQMISVGPIALFADTPGEISYPIVRDVDTNMYERQHGGDMEVGSYAHRPIIVPPDEIPSIEESVLSPTEMPFTQEDFDPQLEQALELMPELLGDEKAGIRYAINGLISMTPDGHPLLGEMPEAKGLWSAAASWIKEGPGCGRAVAELMSGRVPTVDVHEADAARFYPHQQTVEHVRGRAREGFNKMYGIVHPAEQWESGRPVRVGPAYERERALGAVFYETAGWERPFWYASNSGAAGAVRGPADGPDGRMGVALVVAGHQRRAPGHAGRLRPGRPVRVRRPGDIRARRAGRGAEPVGGADEPAGRPGRLHLLAGRERRVPRRPDGDAAGRRPVPGGDRRRDRDVRRGVDPPPPAARRVPGRPHLGLDHDRAVGAAGQGRTGRGDGRRRVARGVRVRHLPGDRGRRDRGARVADLLRGRARLGTARADRAGPAAVGHAVGGRAAAGLVPAGIGVYGTTGRLEKGYRAFGAELTPDYTLVEAGMTRPKVKAQEFIGKEAYLRQRSEPPCAVMCTLTVDSHESADGSLRYMLGGEPILSADGERLVDAKGRPSYVTSAGSGPSVGRHLLMAYLPASHAVEGNSLLVEYMGEQYPVTVARASATPLFDPENARIRS